MTTSLTMHAALWLACPLQVITLSDDQVARVWDLRNHKCLQAIARNGEQAQGSGCSAAPCPAGFALVWQLCLPGLHCLLCCLLPASTCLPTTFCSADWLRPEDSKPTAMCYDSARRRLVW